ncbi:hypothetical protein [Butyrivibrio sp. WCD3002]|uniref:YczE/YyaS/YitT family protein n=1 Tax=Butyrivibrio sp. WCD3002 TaxID=1280676 RepID=UPI001A98BA16
MNINQERRFTMAVLDRFTKDPLFKKKFTVMSIGVFLMGFFLSFLIKVDLGTDPCTFMNVTLSNRLGIGLGTWQLGLNLVLFILVILYARNLIGPGTVANMVFIGYIAEFFGWLWKKNLPEYLFTTWPYRALVFAFALLCFVIAASFYMNADMGVAPYDAIPVIISERLLKKIPFKYVRMGFDGSVTVIALLFGGKARIATVLMVFLLGPTISIVGRFLGKHVFKFGTV